MKKDIFTVLAILAGMILIPICGIAAIFVIVLGPPDSSEYEGPSYSLSTDGRSIYETHSPMAGYEPYKTINVLERIRRGASNTHSAEFKIEKLKSGSESIRVTYRHETSIRKGFSISNPVWSRKNHRLFFFETSQPDARGGNLTRIWQWKPGAGFYPVSKGYPWISDLSLSLDENHVTAIVEDYQGNAPTHLTAYSLSTGLEEKLPCPQRTVHAILLGKDHYLFGEFGKSNFCEVRQWKNGQSKPFDFGGQVIDVVAFDGRIWAIRLNIDKDEIVRLNSNLDGIEENFGVIK